MRAAGKTEGLQIELASVENGFLAELREGGHNYDPGTHAKCYVSKHPEDILEILCVQTREYLLGVLGLDERAVSREGEDMPPPLLDE